MLTTNAAAAVTQPTTASKKSGWIKFNEKLARWVFPLMVGVSAAAFWVCFPDKEIDGWWWVSLAVFLVLSGFPSWLYLRFLTVKLTPIYREYVSSLYRLGIDEPGSLPKPLESSRYFKDWQAAQSNKAGSSTDQQAAAPQIGGSGAPAGGATPPTNLYDLKFESYYGSWDEKTRFSGLGSLLPVVAAWIAFGVGWLTIIVNLDFYMNDLTLEDALRFGFLGAYMFSLQLTVRAFFQNDLRSGTYVGLLERLIVVAILVTVIHVAWESLFEGWGDGLQTLVVFLVGSFPLVGQEWLTQVTASRLRRQVPSISSQHPLSEIDGMSVWYQARLLEEGIEDVQNLATANIVDVVMHSRAPVGRIVDWIDQALLRQHLPPRKPPSKGKESKDRRASDDEMDNALLQVLDALGVRTATDLLGLFSPLSQESAKRLGSCQLCLEPADAGSGSFHARMVNVVGDERKRQVVELRMLGILRCLGTEPNLRYVLHWQTGPTPNRECSSSADDAVGSSA